MDSVARDVLHHLAAGAHERSVAKHEARAQDAIARSAEAQPPCARRVRGEHAAERRAPGMRALERQLLPTSRELVAQARDRNAALGGEREVFGLVLDESIEPAEIDREPVARRGSLSVARDRCAAAPRHDREFLPRRGAQQLAQLVAIVRARGITRHGARDREALRRDGALADDARG